VTWIGWLAPGHGEFMQPRWAALATLGDEDELEQSIERAWLTWSRQNAPSHRERLRFRQPLLEHYPLTQPVDICQRCHRWLPWPDDVPNQPVWDLDHIVELQFGGLDHPANLVRLCRPCHKSKPFPSDALLDRDDVEGIRRFVLAWVRRGPPGGVREKWDWTE
jgi:hypothetical protein